MIVLSDHADHIAIAIEAALGGGGFVGIIQRVSLYVSKNLAPLPANSNWWATTAYQLVKGLSGVDPNAISLSQESLKTLSDSVIKQVVQAANGEKQS